MQINTKKFNNLIKLGFLKKQKHPRLDLFTWNYTQKCQYEQAWSRETLLCRGLITDIDGNVCERPFPKFFNYEEHVSNGGAIPNEFPIVSEKMDGSLGILYQSDDGLAIATRGSFVSPQAKKATQILRKKYPDFVPDSRFTYLFEIVYPENRIVVDYRDLEDLFFLAGIDRQTGKKVEIYPPLTRVNSYALMFGNLDYIDKENLENREGVVLYYPKANLFLKIKFEDYLKKHRIKTQLTERMIWQNLMEKRGIGEIIENAPDEFFNGIEKVAKALIAQFDEIFHSVKSIVETEILSIEDRKKQAIYIIENHKKNAELIFALLDNKKIEKIIWKKIKPEPNLIF